MNRPHRLWVPLGLSAVLVVSMGVSLVWRSAVGPCDYIAQAALLLLMLALAFVADLDRSFLRYFAWMFSATFVWGVWRVIFFDRVTGNDPGPDIVYLFPPIIYGILSWVVFVVRVLVVRFFL